MLVLHTNGNDESDDYRSTERQVPEAAGKVGSKPADPG